MASPPISSSLMLIRQTRRALFRALTAEQAVIVFVREGTKIVRHASRQVRIERGSLGILPARLALTVENRPGTSGRYVASALVPDPGLVRSMRGEGLNDGDPFAKTAHDRTVAAFERAATLIGDPLTPPALREHAVREVLLWLAEDGIGLGPDRSMSFSDRLRTILSDDPAADWRASGAAQALAVSEATLRRRLASDGTAFGDLLADVRMTQGLGLLQTTDLPVNRIALDCGYVSASRFAVRFRARFGIAPSAIRTRGIDRRGIEDDRIGITKEAGRD